MEALALGKSDYAVTVVYVEGYDTAISCIADMSTQLGIDNPFASDYYQEDIGAYVWNVKTLMQEANPELGYTDGVFMLYDDGSLYLVSEINPYNVESVSLGKLYDNNLGYTAEDIQYLKRGVTTYEQR
jgi:hypothetical protein